MLPVRHSFSYYLEEDDAENPSDILFLHKQWGATLYNDQVTSYISRFTYTWLDMSETKHRHRVMTREYNKQLETIK